MYSHFRHDGPATYVPLAGLGWLFSVPDETVKIGRRRKLPINASEVKAAADSIKRFQGVKIKANKGKGSIKSWATNKARRAADPEFDAHMREVISLQRTNAVKKRWAKSKAAKLLAEQNNNKSGDIATTPNNDDKT